MHQTLMLMMGQWLIIYTTWNVIEQTTLKIALLVTWISIAFVKFEAVECVLNDGLIDIFALSESKIDESFPNAQFIINGFSLHRKDRNRFGGGLLLYIRSDIPHRRRCDLEPNGQIPHGIEIMVIEARLYKMEKWHLVIIYKPPKVTKNSFENTLTEMCQSLEKESPHWFIMGDTNLDVSHVKSLSDLCVVYNLSNLVDGPTCFKGDTPSSIDVLLSTEPKRFKNSLNSSCSISDFHNLTCVATKLHKPHIEPKTIYYRSYRNFDDIFLNDVQNIPFWISDVFEDEDDRLWSFGKLFSDVIDKNAPIKKRTLKKPSLPYMNSSLRRAIHKKNMLYNSYRKGKVPWETYRKQRNLTTAINQQSKATYFRERCEGGPKKQKFWRTIKPFITDKNASHCNKIILQEGDKIITDTQEICEIFNAFFRSVADDIGFDDVIPPDYYTDKGFSAIIKRHCNHPSITKIKENNTHNDMFHFQSMNHFDVVKIINDFDSKKAQGYDRMPMKMLQKSAKYIAPAIANMINDSMSKCVFPDSLKFAEVSSLFKKKDTLIKTNYRPVSILVALSKIYEKAVGVQLTDYFNSVFSTLLSAFRKGYSCQSALLHMIENFKSALDKSEYVACISMDISKAFDCLPHCLTICKLFAYGLSRDACILIASYLFQRKQRVKIGNNKSDWEEINKGVPQGSILGPLLFNIFLNDIFYFVTKGNMYNYADDNSISVSHKKLALLSRQLQTEAEVTFQWFLDNAMEANPTKFQGLLLKGNKPATDFRVSIRGQEITFSKSITALGICIDENLTFDEHVNNICLKASRQISALQRLTNFIDMPGR